MKIPILISLLSKYIFCSLMVVSCISPKIDVRNQIRFEDSSEVVEDSLRQIITLLKKLPQPNSSMVNFFLVNNELHINSMNVGDLRGVDFEKAGKITDFSKNECTKFIDLVLYLRRNKITGTYKSLSNDCFLFDYRAVKDNSAFNIRELFLKEEGKRYEALATYEVLDQKGKLVLIKFSPR